MICSNKLHKTKSDSVKYTWKLICKNKGNQHSSFFNCSLFSNIVLYSNDASISDAQRDVGDLVNI